MMTEQHFDPAVQQGQLMLQAQDLSVTFGGLCAVKSVSLNVYAGQVHALIGPNGAGKSTVINALSGFVPTAGRISIGGQVAARWHSHSVARAGLARTFQNIRLFGGMTVEETILVGRHARFGGGLLAALCRRRQLREQERVAREEVARLIRFVGLPPDAAQLVATDLPYGHQRRVEIARALISQPKVLLLDEPFAGMNALEKTELSQLIRTVCRGGVAVLLVEHDMGIIRELADHVTVLYHGQLLVDGTPEAVLSHPEVQAAYLGKGKA